MGWFSASMQPNITQFQKRHFSLLARVSPFSIAGHLVNTTVVAFALVGSVPEGQLIAWCIYSYSIALLLLYRHLRKRGRSPRDFKRAAKKVTTYSLFMALPWSTLVVLHLGALSRDQELIVVALAAGMAATGTILLSTVPPAAFVYMSVILIPSALKCFALNETRYMLLAALALSCWGFLAALIAKIIRDTQEREQAEQSLAEQSLQRGLGERAALVGSFAYDTHTDRIEISPGFAAIHGFPEETAEIPRSEWLACLHPEDADRLYVLQSRAFSNRQREYNTDYRIVRSGGEVRWIDARNFIEYDDGGYARRVIGVNIDVTERKQAEEHRKFLNAELDHRVKNALATVSAVVSHTLQGHGSLAELVVALDGRIRSMATTHELLSASRWQGIPVRELTRRELAPYATSDNTDIDGPEVLLKPQAGQVVAMVLHELVTNAAKYGALSVPGGRVSVHWTHGPNEHAQSWLCINWQERGGPIVAPESQSSYGTNVIRDMIPYSLRGTVDLAYVPDGVCCKIQIPDSWLIGGIKPAIIRLADATAPSL
jgi:PAS domain S-box-containing protein